MRFARTLAITATALLALPFIPSSAQAAGRGSATFSNTYGFASATWTWNGPGSLTDIDLHVEDDECNGQPVYAVLRVTFTNDGTRHTSTLRYDYNGCGGTGTNHLNLTYSDNFTIKYVAIKLCNEDAFDDTCSTGANSGKSPYA